MDLLFKNPNTDFGLYAKALKNGVCIGNVVDAHNYEITFQDKKYSYLPEESNQLDFQSYCSPLAVMDICSDFFNHLLKSKEEFEAKEITWLNTTQGAIDTQACTIEIPTFFVKSGWMRDGVFLLEKYLPQIKLKHSVGNNYHLRIESTSVFEGINLLCVVSVFTHLTNDYGVFIYVAEDFAQKYARIMTNIKGVPYFVFYLFIKRGIKNLKMFEVVKPIFEEYLAKNGMETELTFLSTHVARIEYITERMSKQLPILDVGCGEFLYYKKFMHKGFFQPYFAIDKEERFKELGETIASRYNENNLQFFTSLDKFSYEGKVNIVLTEVIEHNTIEDAKALLAHLLTYNFDELIVTTPNVDFNKYYSEDLESRHDDHHFELTAEEFKSMMNAAIVNNNFISVSFDYIGDKINGTQPTQVCIFKNLKP